MSRADTFTHISGAHFRFRRFLKSQITGDQHFEYSETQCGVCVRAVYVRRAEHHRKYSYFSVFSFCYGIRCSASVCFARAVDSIEWRYGRFVRLNYLRSYWLSGGRMEFSEFCKYFFFLIFGQSLELFFGFHGIMYKLQISWRRKKVQSRSIRPE